MLRSSFSVLLCSPTATGTAVQPGARTPPTAPRPTWASAAPPTPRGHTDRGWRDGWRDVPQHSRAGAHPRDKEHEQHPLLMAQDGNNLAAEGRETSTTQRRSGN